MKESIIYAMSSVISSIFACRTDNYSFYPVRKSDILHTFHLLHFFSYSFPSNEIILKCYSCNCPKQVLNLRQQSGRFNFSTQFPFYQETLYKPDFTNRKLGKPVIFDMDMSAGDFISLIYLLKVPVEVMDLKVNLHSTIWFHDLCIKCFDRISSK